MQYVNRSLPKASQHQSRQHVWASRNRDRRHGYRNNNRNKCARCIAILAVAERYSRRPELPPCVGCTISKRIVQSTISLYRVLMSQLFSFRTLSTRKLPRDEGGADGVGLSPFVSTDSTPPFDRPYYGSPASAIVTSPDPWSCTSGDVTGRMADRGRPYPTSR
jgi:hypothetical protein